MASPTILEIDSLLSPIDWDETPAGKPLPFTIKQQIEEARKEIDPNDWAADDPQRPAEPKMADWKVVIQVTQKTLRETTKDLQLAVDLLEALTRQHGSAGLRDGLTLLRRLTEECWDRLYPMVEDGDVEFWQEKMLGIFESLDTPSKRLNFPETIRRIPMVIVRDPYSKDILKRISWRDWDAMGKGDNEDAAQQKEEYEKAVMAMDAEDIQNIKGDLEETVSEVTKLFGLLNEKFGANAPSLSGLRGALMDVKKQVDYLASRKGDPAGAVSASPDGASAAAPVSMGGGAMVPAGGGGMVMMQVPNVAATRAEVYRQLAYFANRLKDMEPHSPIPYLIERAVKLGAMPFPELVKNLIRNGEVITELYREFGIKEETPAEGGGDGSW
jgi:type VI secretion system protein ImpA